MTVAAFTGRHPGVGQGMLECGKTLSPVQMVLERDFVGGLRQYERRLDPTAANLNLDDIVAVDLGMTDNYLETLHTARHFRDNLWMPQLVDRRGWNGAADDAAMIERARAQVADLRAQYVKPEGREEKLAAMQVEGKAQPMSFRDLYRMWWETSEELYIELFRTEEFSKLQGQLVDKGMQFRRDFQAYVEEATKELPFPNRSEMDHLYKIVDKLKREVRTLKKELKELRGATGEG
jgi:polyhydroxyalkanoate synthesis regulator phasin